MGILKRIIVLSLAIFALLGLGASTAMAQDRPPAPPMNPSPSLNLPEAGGDQNDFQRAYAQCVEENQDKGAWEKLADTGEGNLWGEFFGAPDSPLLGLLSDELNCASTETWNHPGDAASAAVDNAASAFWGDPVGDLAKAVMEGNVSAFATVMTFWMSVPIPGLSGSAGMDGIRNLTWELQLAFLGFGIVFAGIRLALARKQAVLDGAEESAKMITRTIFAVTLLPLLVLTLHAAGDVFSAFVIEQATGDSNAAISGIAWIDEETGLGPVVSLLFAGLSLLGSVIQLIALIVREAILTLAVALAPIAAAISVTNNGRMSWSSIMTFTIGALLFKPVASLIYAFAFWASSSDDAASAIVGAVLLAVAGLALPQIIRIVAPAAESISGSGEQMASMAGATGAMAGSIASRGGSSHSVSGAGGAGGASGSGSGGSGGASGTGGSAASGASYGGPYTGGGSRGAAAARTTGKAMSGAAGLAGGAIGGAAKALQVAGTGVRTASNIAEGSVGNYHGRINR